VRDAAVELIGKYMIESSAVAADYYRRIAERIQDTGLGVRKRVIRLLRTLYDAPNMDVERRVDICTKIVLRMFDDDDGVKELAIKSIEEMWFTDASASSDRKRVHSSQEKVGRTDENVSILMGVCTFFKDRQSPLEDMLHSIMTNKSGSESEILLRRYTKICETLIDGLVDNSEIPGFVSYVYA
jgi:cohesin loading factor subunit SCC2